MGIDKLRMIEIKVEGGESYSVLFDAEAAKPWTAFIDRGPDSVACDLLVPPDSSLERVLSTLGDTILRQNF